MRLPKHVDTYAEKFPLMSMLGQADGLVCADPVVRTPISMNGIFSFLPKETSRYISAQEHQNFKIIVSNQKVFRVYGLVNYYMFTFIVKYLMSMRIR